MMNSIGKQRRLDRIFSHTSKKIILVPLDDSLLAGPTNGLESLAIKTQKIISASPNAIIGFQGLLKNFSNIIGQTPTILNLTASTTNIFHTNKILVGTLELAVMLDVQAVAVHVNISSKYESAMLKNFSEIAFECNRLGIPLMGIMYPRNENGDGSDNNYSELKLKERMKYAKLVAHTVRIAFELGADLVKTQYTGDSESFSIVTAACNPLPVVIAGGPQINMIEILKIAEGAMRAGAAGVSFGRNIFSRDNPQDYINALKKVIYEQILAEEAISFYNS
jgi:DhnA family fructose-bisphosphate aldolase class Ia